MKKVIILILTMIMFIIPVNASNILINYNETVSGIKNYINSFDNYDKYILNNSEIPFIYKNNKVSYNSSFNGNSGLLNEIEFKLGKEYLYNGLSYWLVYDSKYIEVTPFYKDKGYINNTKSSSDTSGIKPTVYINNNASVKGEGSRLNPFEFARIYDVIISTSNKNYGLLKKNNTSEETETITQQVGEGGVSTVIISPKEGYQYVKTSNANDCNNKVELLGKEDNILYLYNITSGFKCNVYFEPINYILTVNPNGGTWNGTSSVSTFIGTIGETKTINNPTKTGYTVTFNSNGGSSASSKTSTKVFSSWTKSGSGTISGTTFTYGSGDSTLKANYSNGSITLPSTTRSGYTFNGWYTASSGGTKVGTSGNSYTPTSNITLYAHWTSNSGSSDSSTTITNTKLTVDPNGGTWNGTSSVSTFTGLTNSTKDISDPTPPSYTVSFNTNGGSTISSKTVTYNFFSWDHSGGGNYYNSSSGKYFKYGTTDGKLSAYYISSGVTLTNPSKSGYAFDGWYTSLTGGTYIGTAGTLYTPTSNITLYAHWTLNSSTTTKVTLTVNPNGGTWNGTSSKSTFTGVKDETKTIGAPTPPSYTVSFNSNGGSSVSSKTSTKTFSSWTKSGYGTFSGTTFTYGNGDSTLTANYTNGSITLPSTTRSGYTFDGWYTASSGGTKIGAASSSYTPTYSRTLYAHWTAKTKTMYVTASSGLNCRTGAGTSYSISTAYTCGTALTVNQNATNGWYYVPSASCYASGDYLSTTKSSCGSGSSSSSGSTCTYVKCLGTANSEDSCKTLSTNAGAVFMSYNGKGDCYAKKCTSCPSGWTQVDKVV